MDYVNRYPEAIPLRHTSAKLIAKEMFAIFCRVGLPKKILTDQAMMKVLLVLGVVLTISVALSSAQCYTDDLKADLKTRKRVCEYKGAFYDIGTDWTSGCERCSCHKRGMECCPTMQIPVNYDKENCEAILNKETCSYTVTRKDDPSVECEVYGVIG
ncbi:beta-microseminoprotein-like [Leptodactylus fuscus]|uniref:beta-microseminoprotein-like n=1 Tax=Leptodactylus fuscus TaxID=238119 RepID=UPI003F4EC1D1